MKESILRILKQVVVYLLYTRIVIDVHVDLLQNLLISRDPFTLIFS